MAKSEGRGLGYGPPCNTVSRPDITPLPRIIGCADMPGGAAMPRLPRSREQVFEMPRPASYYSYRS